MNELEKLIYQKLSEGNNQINISISTSADSLNSGRENLDIIQQNMNNSSIKPFEHEGIIGKIKIFIKKVIRKLTKFYVEPFANQQTKFNEATYWELENNRAEKIELANKIKVLENQNILTKIDYGNISEKTETLLETIINVSKKYEELNRDINVKLNDRINALSNDNAFLKEELVKQATSLANRNLTTQSYNPMEYKTTYSQSGEDAIIKYILFELQRYEKVSYLDLGANHAKEISNTYGLYEAGASGVLVEANPYLITELELYRNRDVILNKCISTKDDEELEFYIFNGDGLSTPDYEAAQKMLEINENLFIKDTVKVKTISINTIIDKYFKNKAPEVVNIDIEGMEMEILEQIYFETFRPLIYIIETIPYTKELVEREKTEEIIDFMKKKGYVEYAFTGINSIFIDGRQIGNK